MTDPERTREMRDAVRAVIESRGGLTSCHLPSHLRGAARRAVREGFLDAEVLADGTTRYTVTKYSRLVAPKEPQPSLFQETRRPPNSTKRPAARPTCSTPSAKPSGSP